MEMEPWEVTGLQGCGPPDWNQHPSKKHRSLSSPHVTWEKTAVGKPEETLPRTRPPRTLIPASGLHDSGEELSVVCTQSTAL